MAPTQSEHPAKAISDKPLAKTTPSPAKKTTQNGFRSFSIKAAANGDLTSKVKNKEKTAEEVSTNELRNKVSNNDLLSAWLEYSNMHKENRVLLSQIMDEHKPVLQEDGETYQIIVFNAFQEQKIQEYALDIANHLRTRVRNSFIRMKIEVDETKDEKQFFTSTDKLKLMVEANPNLNLLRKAFDLDLE